MFTDKFVKVYRNNVEKISFTVPILNFYKFENYMCLKVLPEVLKEYKSTSEIWVELIYITVEKCVKYFLKKRKWIRIGGFVNASTSLHIFSNFSNCSDSNKKVLLKVKKIFYSGGMLFSSQLLIYYHLRTLNVDLRSNLLPTVLSIQERTADTELKIEGWKPRPQLLW